jgi:hypothetical protein
MSSVQHKHGPIYELGRCAHCRVAKIRASRPSRARQDADIWFISFYYGIAIEQIHHELKTL